MMQPDYSRPTFDPKAAERLQKPAKRQSVVKRGVRRAKKLTRAQVVDRTWKVFGGKCIRCGRTCIKPKDTYPTDPARGEVNDIVPRSLGGNPLDPKNQELVCHGCHFSGPSGAHAPTKARKKKR